MFKASAAKFAKFGKDFIVKCIQGMRFNYFIKEKTKKNRLRIDI